IWANRDRPYNIRCLVKRLQRIDKEMSAEAREQFARFISDGDLARYAKGLPAALDNDFTGAMQLLRDKNFQDLLMDYPRKPRMFYVAYGTEDIVGSQWLIRDSAGAEYQPEDYLTAFGRFVKENETQVEAIAILLGRPQGWGTIVSSGTLMGTPFIAPNAAHRQPSHFWVCSRWNLALYFANLSCRSGYAFCGSAWNAAVRAASSLELPSGC